MGLVRQVLEALEIPHSSRRRRGRRRDRHARDTGRATRARRVIVTGDRDAYQLVDDPHVKVLYNKRGVSDYALYDEAGILERTGVTPAQYPEYAALRGDPSDNLAGRARASARRRPPSSSPPTAASTASSTTSTSFRRSSAQNLGEHEEQVRATPRS